MEKIKKNKCDICGKEDCYNIIPKNRIGLGNPYPCGTLKLKIS